MIGLNIFELVVLLAALALGLFPNAMAAGVESCMGRLGKLKVAFVFATFKTAFLGLGFFLGSFFSEMVPEAAFWVVVAIFLVLGLKMIFESIRADYLRKSYAVDKTNILFLLAVAVNLDGLIAGMAFGFTTADFLLLLVLAFGLAMLVSLAGLAYGRIAANLMKGARVGLVGGLILSAYSLFLLLQRSGGFV